MKQASARLAARLSMPLLALLFRRGKSGLRHQRQTAVPSDGTAVCRRRRHFVAMICFGSPRGCCPAGPTRRPDETAERFLKPHRGKAGEPANLYRGAAFCLFSRFLLSVWFPLFGSLLPVALRCDRATVCRCACGGTPSRLGIAALRKSYAHVLMCSRAQRPIHVEAFIDGC